MRIVVTGASGNVGSQVTRQLLEHPDVTSVVGLCRRPPVADRSGITWHARDLACDRLTDVLAGADAVIHLAFLLQPAHDEAVMARTNLTGSQRVFDAVAALGVPALVHASSVGAYSPGPDARVDESHPTGGIATSSYSRHKAELESRLDALEAAHPHLRVVRIRPGIIMQKQAASAIARYFLGPLVPQRLLSRRLVPVVPRTPGFAIPALHAEDAAAAFVRAATGAARGAFNIAAEPVLDAETLGEALGARPVPVPRAVLRGVLDVTWRLHLQPPDPGWIDLAIDSPLMDTGRARRELGWLPVHTSTEALLDLLDGMTSGAGGPGGVLQPRARGLARLREAVQGLTPGAGRTG